MMTYGSIAKISTTATLAGVQSADPGYGLETPMTRNEATALAIGKVAELNIIQPKGSKSGAGLMQKEKSGPGLNRQTYNSLGKMGTMIALKRAGSSTLGLTGSLLNEVI